MKYDLAQFGLNLNESEHRQLEDDVQDLISKYIGREFVCSDEKKKHQTHYFKIRNNIEYLISQIRGGTK